MAENKKKIKEAYPIPGYNFKVSIWDPASNVFQPYPFSEVSGLNIELEPVTYKHGLSFIRGAEQTPGMQSEHRITLKRGIVPKRNSLLKWFSNSLKGDLNKRKMIIDLCDDQGLPVIRWKALNAIPIKLEGPSLNADSNDVAIENLEILANHLTIEYIE